jgi:hypothetical protein
MVCLDKPVKEDCSVVIVPLSLQTLALITITMAIHGLLPVNLTLVNSRTHRIAALMREVKTIVEKAEWDEVDLAIIERCQARWDKAWEIVIHPSLALLFIH